MTATLGEAANRYIAWLTNRPLVQLPFSSFAWRLYNFIWTCWLAWKVGYDQRWQTAPSLRRIEELGIAWHALAAMVFLYGLLILGPPAVRMAGWFWGMFLGTVALYSLLHILHTVPQTPGNPWLVYACGFVVGGQFIGFWNSGRLWLRGRHRPSRLAP